MIYSKGSCLLVLQKDKFGKPVHVVRGIQKIIKTTLFWLLPISMAVKNGIVLIPKEYNNENSKDDKIIFMKDLMWLQLKLSCRRMKLDGRHI